jgi:hypothetical protein
MTLMVIPAEPSHTAFYIAGAVFVVWAVALAARGLTQPDFPGSALGERAVMLVSLVLAAAVIATAIATSR